VKAVPLPDGAQSGWAPLAWKKRAQRVGWAAGWALAERHIPESITLPAPRPRRIDRRDGVSAGGGDDLDDIMFTASSFSSCG
jgi:hypothetical protein